MTDQRWSTKIGEPTPDGLAWCTLDRLWAGAAGRWVRAREEESLAEMQFHAVLFGGHDNDDPGLLPGRDADKYGCDLSDWNGVSLEIYDYQGEPPTLAECDAIFALGFTVIRIEYRDREHWTSQHKFHGDWWCVKGEEPRTGKPMTVGVDRCPTHFYGNGPEGPSGPPASGQCRHLFGHDGAHEHGDDAKRGAEARI